MTLPSKLPLLLMLGAEGIAVGLSTRILPHNFIELLEAEIQIIQETKKKPAVIDVLPDFQTGGMMDVSEYDKGFGKIKVRACIEKQGTNKLMIKELPCMQTTESVIRSIEEAVKKKKGRGAIHQRLHGREGRHRDHAVSRRQPGQGHQGALRLHEM